MALRQLRYEGDEILRKKCKKVEEVDDHIRMILDDMLDTLHNTEMEQQLQHRKLEY